MADEAPALDRTAQDAMPDHDLGPTAEAMIRDLAGISADPDRLTRLYLTPEHRRAADLVSGWMTAAGLSVSEDALGTVRGSLPATVPEAPVLLLGSHLDTVVDAGAYDGTLGVVAAVLAAAHLARRPERAMGLTVLAFGDEEGSRFPVTLMASHACAGRFDPAWLAATDRDGMTVEAALRRYGKDPGRIAEAALPPAAAYVEVHIEQGPVLEEAGEALGVVTAIAGATRCRLVIAGRAGHAGTVPMALRRDALAGAAEIVLLVERLAAAAGEGVVATIGCLEAEPGAPNVIPGRVTLSLDLRAPSDAVREALFADLHAKAGALAGRRGLALELIPGHEAGAVACEAVVQDGLARAVEAGGGRALRLVSGAGHDGQAMAALCPVGMLFVRCRGGVSHNPAEHASADDMGRAVAALIRFLEDPSLPASLAAR